MVMFEDISDVWNPATLRLRLPGYELPSAALGRQGHLRDGSAVCARIASSSLLIAADCPKPGAGDWAIVARKLLFHDSDILRRLDY